MDCNERNFEELPPSLKFPYKKEMQWPVFGQVRAGRNGRTFEELTHLTKIVIYEWAAMSSNERTFE